MERKRKNNKILWISTLLVLVIVFFSIEVGSYPLSFDKIFHVLIQDPIKEMDAQVLFQLRLPRVFMGVLAGVVFGVCGGIFQLLFHNSLASCDLLGVSSGASLGAATMIILGQASVYEMMLGSFVGGMLVLIFVLLLASWSHSSRSETFILAGIMMSAIANACLMLLKYVADTEGELAAIEFWTMGSLATMTLSKLCLIVLPLIFCLICFFYLRKDILLLGFGEIHAQILGMNVKRKRQWILSLATLATSCIISLTGVISFVGLIAPHLAYLCLKTRTQGFLYLSGIIGAGVVVLADCLARGFSVGEIPISILTTFCAIPFFLYLLIHRKGAIQ